MPKLRVISDEVREVLTASTTEGNLLRLPDIQLDRTLYVAVNKTLTDLGGKWNRGKKAHVFKGDAGELLAKALDDGGTVNEKQELQSFFTPRDLADYVVEFAHVKDKMVLEPSAGEGALAEACVRAGSATVFCFEIHEPFATALARKGFGTRCLDFLQATPAQFYERIVMNPPFTKNQDVAHVRRALQWLRSGGRLVAIMAGNDTRRAFVELTQELDEGEYGWETFKLPEGSFKSSGTGVNTMLLVVMKNPT